MLPPFTPPRYPTDEPLTRTQDAVSDSLRGVLRVGMLDGASVTASLKPGASTLVPHGIGRVVEGWLVTDKDAAADVWRVKGDERTGLLALRSNANVNVTLWVW